MSLGLRASSRTSACRFWRAMSSGTPSTLPKTIVTMMKIMPDTVMAESSARTPNSISRSPRAHFSRPGSGLRNYGLGIPDGCHSHAISRRISLADSLPSERRGTICACAGLKSTASCLSPLRAPPFSGNGPKARYCCSCSVSATRSNTTRWAAPRGRSRRSPSSRRKRHE